MRKQIAIRGMECEYCASQVMKALLGIYGINSVDLNFAEKSAIVELVQEVNIDKFKIAVDEAECRIVEIKDI